MEQDYFTQILFLGDSMRIEKANQRRLRKDFIEPFKHKKHGMTH